MTNMICFDMDGTIANLYGVHNWLEMLRAEDPTPYALAEYMKTCGSAEHSAECRLGSPHHYLVEQG